MLSFDKTTLFLLFTHWTVSAARSKQANKPGRAGVRLVCLSPDTERRAMGAPVFPSPGIWRCSLKPTFLISWGVFVV